MKHFLRIAFITLVFPVIAISESTVEQARQEAVCDEPVYYGEPFHLSITQIHERLIQMSWPDIPPPLRLASMNAYVLFQIKVSTSGEVCFIESKFGSPLIVHPLTPEIKKWKFSPNKPFWGVIVIRYKSGSGFHLL